MTYNVTQLERRP